MTNKKTRSVFGIFFLDDIQAKEIRMFDVFGLQQIAVNSKVTSWIFWWAQGVEEKNLIFFLPEKHLKLFFYEGKFANFD